MSEKVSHKVMWDALWVWLDTERKKTRDIKYRCIDEGRYDQLPFLGEREKTYEFVIAQMGRYEDES